MGHPRRKIAYTNRLRVWTKSTFGATLPTLLTLPTLHLEPCT
jgi:hypothetical protein